MQRRALLKFAFGCAVLAADAAQAQTPKTVLAAVPISRTDLPWWRARHQAKLEELRRRRPDLVFYGDSITQQYEDHGPPEWKDFAPIWERFYGRRNAVNLGFTGDTTASLLWRIQNGQASGIAPKVAVVLIGANNLGRVHWGTEETLAGIEASIAALQRRLASTRILLLGILPSDRSTWATETTLAVNRGLATRYPNGHQVTYLDVGHVFMQSGQLNRDLFYDPKLSPPGAPLHPSSQGQALIAEAIEPTLTALLRIPSNR